MDSIKKAIKTIVCEHLKDSEIEEADSLFDKGIDSMNILFIISKIEKQFDVEIPDEELLIDNFENINQIAKLIQILKENKL